MSDEIEEENSVKRRLAVVLGAAVIAIASPAVAVADTGSASTGSASGVLGGFEMLSRLWEACAVTIFTGQCTGVVATDVTYW
ncbi:hypothetical protein CH306_15535 [Rhodococcus sp. 15-725-2-2b]|uniref:hypothetical protein n=1 Tax=Nocardiaceae TaxID=85025 RepID=UPI00050BE439|nr:MULTISPECIES: hypothetical protein [Rhodococcus]AJW43135.1 hypothetical protein NY08_5141 [Rhodococcus sp. B7740]OZC60055.1 hypothetical protein CH276_18960 [Rhodococcus sp. 06-470-2]OZC66234.1 hypothetical protein CH277_14620 [Rhodococcus sp. 06-469-3-2]OZC87441.1 hypothetical protein CH274_01030 [Rhodococcus sp. 06-418-5]OZD44878.1 hypothetical protein CH264_10505 [Rhodococcus sp. 06-1477-1A]